MSADFSGETLFFTNGVYFTVFNQQGYLYFQGKKND